jgi:hypothetical protein
MVLRFQEPAETSLKVKSNFLNSGPMFPQPNATKERSWSLCCGRGQSAGDRDGQLNGREFKLIEAVTQPKLRTAKSDHQTLDITYSMIG